MRARILILALPAAAWVVAPAARPTRHAGPVRPPAARPTRRSGRLHALDIAAAAATASATAALSRAVLESCAASGPPMGLPVTASLAVEVGRGLTAGTDDDYVRDLLPNCVAGTAQDGECNALPVRVLARGCRPLAFRQTEFQEMGGSTGAQVWKDGVVLSRYMDTLGRSAWQGKRAIELGSGGGVGAITARALGADVLATDIQPRVLELAAANAAANFGPGTALRTQVLAFGDPRALAEAAASGPFDYVIGSDWGHLGPKVWPEIAASLDTLVTKDTVALYVGTPRFVSEWATLQRLFAAKGLESVDVGLDPVAYGIDEGGGPFRPRLMRVTRSGGGGGG